MHGALAFARDSTVHILLLYTFMIFLSQVGRARFRAPELLFHPVLIGEESEGIHQVSIVVYCILKIQHKHALDLPSFFCFFFVNIPVTRAFCARLQHNMHDDLC